ncbi:MAG: hypothetical protein CMD83_18060 [Gammaproteobacteria bacterium]|nr:hypothetical protein [Gammaproteobacteria bacterium]
MDENQFQILATEVKASLDVLTLKMDDIKEKQEEVVTVVNRVEKSLYEPDLGLYARVRDLEQWKKSQSKIMVIVGSTTLSMAVYFVKTFVEFMMQ